MQLKISRHHRARWWLVPLLAAGTGCVSQSDEARAANRKAAEEEYVYLTVTGSNIPKRIRKSDVLNGDLPKDGDAQLVDKEQFINSLRPGRKLDRGN